MFSLFEFLFNYALAWYVYMLLHVCCKKKQHIVPKSVAYIAAITAFSAILVACNAAGIIDMQYGWLYDIFTHIRHYVCLIIAAFFMKWMFQTDTMKVLFVAFIAYVAVCISIGVLVGLINIPFFQGRDWLVFLAVLAVIVALGITLYFAFGKNLSGEALQIFSTHGKAIFGLICILTVILIKVASTIAYLVAVLAADGGFNAQSIFVDLALYSAIFTNIGCCAFILIVFGMWLAIGKEKFSNVTLKKMLQKEAEQYEKFKSNVEYINIKCHDLKHFVKKQWGNEIEKSPEAQKIFQSIAEISASADTGNATLDLLVSEWKMYCNSIGIRLAFMTDGTPFTGFDELDIFSMFSNILENAVEGVRTCSEEHREIRLNIKHKGNMVMIHQENFLLRKPKFKGGLPQTTKDDKENHGFGMKSIQSVVKKYKGKMFVDAEDDQFILSILFSA